MSTDDHISLKVEFTGGLELLFSNQRSHTVTIPAFVPENDSADGSAKNKPVNIKYLLRYLRDNLLKERVELFMEDDTMYVTYSVTGERFGADSM